MTKNITSLMERALSLLNLNNKEDMNEELIPQQKVELVKPLEVIQQEMEVDLVDQSVKTFEEIAKQIIKKSIRSAICIDDRFIEPYMSVEKISSINTELKHLNESLSSDIPSELYRSFRKDGECDLDIYHFKNIDESWHPEYMLNNKDLVILDWELEGKGNFESTLIILRKIIEDDKVPFVIIYTQKPKEDFSEIALNIIANFNHNTAKSQAASRENFYTAFRTHFTKISEDKEWEDDQVEMFWEKKENLSLLLDCVLTPSKKDAVLDLLEKAIAKEFKISDFKSLKTKFKTILKNTFNYEYNYNIELLWHLLVDAKSEKAFTVKRIEVNEIGFRINNCIVTLFSKPGDQLDGVSPKNVFTQFSNLISSSPHNFITLLSLEMRDRFREDFSKIGNDISQIDERAFFYHLEYYKKRSPGTYKNQFYDFLLNSWTNELSEYNINLKPLLFDVIEDYQDKNKLKEINGTIIVNSLADLVVKLSTTSLVNRIERDKQIRFGDIFKLLRYDEEGNIINVGIAEYVLSLTPHCVCLDSCKIDNNFYFIKSESVSDNYNSALKKIEVDHYSFVNDNKKVLAVKWGDCKPFTLYIEKNELDKLDSTFMNKIIKLEYVTTLQENFAQRISNKSFSYGTSIGIDLPHLS